jgi:hypothetical protein
MDSRFIKVLVVGPGKSGKGIACEILNQIPDVCYCGSTSEVISAQIAEEEGRPFEDVHIERNVSDESRMRWYDKGRLMCTDNPSRLIEICYEKGLEDSDDYNVLVCDGCRSQLEIFDALSRGVVDVILWIDRDGLPPDPSLKFGKEVATTIIENNGTIEDLRKSLFSWYILLKSVCCP